VVVELREDSAVGDLDVAKRHGNDVDGGTRRRCDDSCFLGRHAGGGRRDGVGTGVLHGSEDVILAGVLVVCVQNAESLVWMADPWVTAELATRVQGIDNEIVARQKDVTCINSDV